MRVWEVEDNKAMPTDLVREQDFILRVRRLQRLGTSNLVINLALSDLENLVKNRTTLEDVQKKLAEFAKLTNGVYCEMSNGDVFMIWEEVNDAHLLADRIRGAILPPAHTAAETEKFLITYHLPRDYTALRERANHYVEVVQAAAVKGYEANPASALQSEAARGPLTAWSVDQIGKLLHNMDIQRYARRQNIYRHASDQLSGKSVWQSVAEEYYISFEDLRRDRFPKLEIITPEHLFLALCETLDHNLIAALTQDIDAILARPVHLNMSVASVAGAAFAQFTHVVPNTKRSSITLELHRGDLFQDFAVTLGAIETLRREGFKVALDAITPDLAAYIDFAAFGVDYIKINVSRERADQLGQAGTRKRLESIPPERLIFFRCDNEKALATGLDLGVSLFQGWLIDDLLAK